MTLKSFKEVAGINNASSLYNGQFVWSTAQNWLVAQSVPVNGDDVSYTSNAGSGTDAQYDNIASLSLNSLSLAATSFAGEQLRVTGDLTIGTLNFTTVGANQAGVEALTNSSTPVTVTINNAITGAGDLRVQSGVATATLIDNATDQGNLSFSNYSGTIYLANAPAASSSFYWDPGSTGVYEFANLGLSIASAFDNVQQGASIELPASRIISVSYGVSSIAIATDIGTYKFSNVNYFGPTSNDYTASIDYATGLEKITFTSAPVLQTTSAAASGVYDGYYQWSKAANWSTGVVPGAGADVAIATTQLNPGFVDDLANVSVSKLMLPTIGSLLTVNGALTIGTLQFGASGAQGQRQILDASTAISGGATTSAITINNMLNVGGGDGLGGAVYIEALGAGATVVVNGVDAGEAYEAFNGGRIVMNVTPSDNSAFFVENGGALVLTSPGTSVAGVTTIHTGLGIEAGSSIELPGSSLISSMSNDGSNPETIVTDYGTYVFTGWHNTSGGGNFGLSDLIATRDFTTGMLKLTTEAAGAADNPQHNNDINGDGFADIVFQNVSGQTASWEMNGTTLASSSLMPSPGPTWKLLTTGDFNGDGKSDLLFQNTSGAIAEWLMNGNSIASAPLPPNPSAAWTVDTTGDFNGDGRSDIALQNNDGSVAIWEMNGGNIIANGAAVVANPSASWKPVASGDFWGDDKSELVLQNTDGSLAFWGFNDSGSGPTFDMSHTAALSASLNPGAQWNVKGTGDFNGDGISDLVFQNSVTGQVAIWEMNQTGLLTNSSFNSFFPPNSDPTWVLTQVGDFNGDGTSDLLFQNSTTGQLDMWTMNGLNIQSSNMLPTNPGTSWHAIG